MPDAAEIFARETRAAVLSGAPVPAGLTARVPAQVARRFGVYRNNVVVGLVEALATRFPVVRRLVGEDFFRASARAFLAAHPPRSPVLTVYGDDFPGFLETFPPASGLAYLADVARLEAARTHAYHAADADPLQPDAVARVADQDPASWGLVAHPALRIVSSAHPIVTIWSMNQPGAAPLPLASPTPETAIVARPRLEVRVVPAEAGEEAFLVACARGASFETAAQAAIAAAPAFDPGRALARILAFGLAAAVNSAPTDAGELA